MSGICVGKPYLALAVILLRRHDEVFSLPDGSCAPAIRAPQALPALT